MDAQALIDRIRRARQLKTQVGPWTFHAVRPTDLEAGSLGRAGATTGELARQFVTGWDGVRVMDLIGGDDQSPVPFDRELWEEFCADRPEVYGPVGKDIMDAYLAHTKAQETARKNLPDGSSDPR